MTKARSLPPLKILPMEKFAGRSDAPSCDRLAGAEARELAEAPGGRDTYAPSNRRNFDPIAKERRANRMIEKAIAKIRG